MNEKRVFNCVQRPERAFLNKFAIIVVALSLSVLTFAQGTSARGTVVSSSNNEPLIGVSVLVVETGQGTVTDIDGVFKINANVGQTLKIS